MNFAYKAILKSWKIQKLLDRKCLTCDYPDMCKQLWGIEILECGVWQDIDYAESLEDALTLASSVVDSDNKFGLNVREEWIRIVTPDNKII